MRSPGAGRTARTVLWNPGAGGDLAAGVDVRYTVASLDSVALAVQRRHDRLRAGLRDPANLASGALLFGLLWMAWGHCRGFSGIAIDDAFITFRYADNLAAGRGLVFNPGERVEGTSSFLETLVLAAARVLGADLLVASRVLGVGAFAALIVGTFLLVRRLVPSHGRLLGAAAAALVASSWPLALYAMSGLETTLFAALLFLGVALHLRAAARADERAERAWSLAMGAVALTRPEGAGYFALLWGLSVVRDLWLRVSSRDVGRRALRRAGWFAAVYMPLVVLRGVYFHALVPNTVTAKSNLLTSLHGKPLADTFTALANGAGPRHLAEYATLFGVALYFALAGLLRSSTRYASFALLAVASAALAVDALDEGDWMPGWRLLTPALAPVAVSIALGLRAVLFQPDQRFFGTQLPSIGVVAALVIPAAVRLYPGGWTPSPMEEYRFWLAKELGTVARPDDVMATDMAGVVPFYSGMRTIDMNGLCDREIALHGKPLGAMGKVDRPYVIGRKPTFFQPNFVGEMRALYDDPSFASMRDDYYAVMTPGYRAGIHIRDRKILAVRKDRPGVRDLAAALGADLVDLGQQLRAEK